MSFHQIKSRERAKYKTVIHCSVLVSPVYKRANTDRHFTGFFVLFTSFASAETDGQIHNAGCISTVSTLFLEKKSQNNFFL